MAAVCYVLCPHALQTAVNALKPEAVHPAG